MRVRSSMKRDQPRLHGVEGARRLPDLRRPVLRQRRAVDVLAQGFGGAGQHVQRPRHPAHRHEREHEHRDQQHRQGQREAPRQRRPRRRQLAVEAGPAAVAQPRPARAGRARAGRCRAVARLLGRPPIMCRWPAPGRPRPARSRPPGSTRTRAVVAQRRAQHGGEHRGARCRIVARRPAAGRSSASDDDQRRHVQHRDDALALGGPSESSSLTMSAMRCASCMPPAREQQAVAFGQVDRGAEQLRQHQAAAPAPAPAGRTGTAAASATAPHITPRPSRPAPTST